MEGCIEISMVGNRVTCMICMYVRSSVDGCEGACLVWVALLHVTGLFLTA